MPKGLVAFIPVSVPVAQDIMGYCPMPLYPSCGPCRTRPGEAVFLANSKLPEPLPPDAKPAALNESVIRSPGDPAAEGAQQGQAERKRLSKRPRHYGTQFAIPDDVATGEYRRVPGSTPGAARVRGATEARWIAECTFGWLNEFLRSSKEYEELPSQPVKR